jgi:dimethylglycine dehydrogenase
VVEGATEWDMWSCDPRRYGRWADQDYTLAKARELYGHEYAMQFPRHAWPAGRNKRLSPIHDRIKALGAQFGAVAGWERANWFAEPGDDTSEQATQTWARSGPWEPRIGAECEAVRDAAGLLDLCGFSRFAVSGAGADEWLRGLVTGALPRIGRMGLVYFTDGRGRIVTEMSVTRVAEDSYTLITAATAQSHDFEWLERHLPAGGAISIEDLTEDYGTLILAGPKSREILGAVCGADLHQPWLTHQESGIAGKRVRLLRVSFTGELGWEVHAAVADMGAVFDAVWAAGQHHGLKPFGMFALDSLRVEKGYRAWKGDLSTDYTMFQGGLDRFVKLDKAQDFLGKAALLSEKQQGVTRRFATMIVEAGDCDAPYMSTIWKDGEVVGETTSGAWGYRVGASIALGMVRADCAQPGTGLEVEIYGERYKATVQPDRPLWDAENARLKA